MRSTTGGEDTILAAAVKNVYTKVEVVDAADAWIDLTDLESLDWVRAVHYGELIDQYVGDARVTLRRDQGALSLSPFRGDSSINTLGALIDAGRGIRISTATTAGGVAVDPADWKLVFNGVIDEADWSEADIEIVARDATGELADLFVEELSEYGTSVGRALESVIQDILDDWAATWTLYVPSTPGFLVTSYQQQKESVLDAIQKLANLIGWVVRYVWDDIDDVFKLTLYEPDRANTTPDWTFAKNRIFGVNQLAIDRADVRNVVVVSFLNSATNIRETVSATSATSVARFGRRWMEIVEADDSPISTTAEAQALADAAVADLSLPLAEQEIELPHFWPAQLGDLYRFSANDIHYNDAQDLAVVSIQHELREGEERTRIQVRGSPAGFYANWQGRGSDVTDDEVEPGTEPSVESITLTEPSANVLQVALALRNTARWVAYERLGNWPTLDTTQTGLVDETYARHENAGGLIYSHAAETGTWYVVVVPFNAEGQAGTRDEASLAISGTATVAGIIESLTAEQFTTYNQLVWSMNAEVDDAAGAYNVEVWRDDVLLVTQDAMIDANGTNPGTADTGGYRDTEPQACVDGVLCIFRTFTYTVILVHIPAGFPDKTYTVDLSGSWQFVP